MTHALVLTSFPQDESLDVRAVCFSDSKPFSVYFETLRDVLFETLIGRMGEVQEEDIVEGICLWLVGLRLSFATYAWNWTVVGYTKNEVERYACGLIVRLMLVGLCHVDGISSEVAADFSCLRSVSMSQQAWTRTSITVLMACTARTSVKVARSRTDQQ